MFSCLGYTNLNGQFQAFLFVFGAMPGIAGFVASRSRAHASTSLRGRILAFEVSTIRGGDHVACSFARSLLHSLKGWSLRENRGDSVLSVWPKKSP